MTGEIASTTALPTPEREPKNYLNAAWTVRSWLLTVDHKRIGLLYLAGITFFFLLGGAAAGLFRLELMTPASPISWSRRLTTSSSRSTASS